MGIGRWRGELFGRACKGVVSDRDILWDGDCLGNSHGRRSTVIGAEIRHAIVSRGCPGGVVFGKARRWAVGPRV